MGCGASQNAVPPGIDIKLEPQQHSETPTPIKPSGDKAAIPCAPEDSMGVGKPETVNEKAEEKTEEKTQGKTQEKTEEKEEEATTGNGTPLAEVAAAPPAEATAAKRKRIRPVEPEPTLTVRIWKGDPLQGTLPYPELSDGDHGLKCIKDKENIAICLGGGGFRATTLATGWVRALFQLGIVQRARYMSSTSGSTWFSAAFLFQKSTSPENFLGTYLPPDKCTFEALQQVDSCSYERTTADAEPMRAYIKNVLENVLDGGDNTSGGWADAIGQAFLAPYDLGDTRSSISAARTAGMVHADVTTQGCSVGLRVLTCMTRPMMPYPIFTASVIMPDTPQVFHPLEFTPLYAGVPANFSATTPALGGYVEPFGLNSRIAELPEDGSDRVLVHTNGVMSLAQMVGASSSYIAQKVRPDEGAVGGLTAGVLGFNKSNLWSPNHLESPGGECILGDGAGADFLAILPPIRRGVSKIVAFIPLSKKPDDDVVEWANYDYDVSRYFGRQPTDKEEKYDGVTPAVANVDYKIFESDGFDRLHEGLKETASSGGPTYHKAKYVTVENAHMGVKGGLEVEIMWIGNCQSAAWEDALPAETKAKINSDRESFLETVEQKLSPLSATGFKEFPYIDTYRMNYDLDLVAMMGQLASWSVHTLKEELEGFLGPAPA